MAESPKAAEKGKRRSLQSCLWEDRCEQFYPKRADQGEKDMRNKAENVLHIWNESAEKTTGNNKKTLITTYARHLITFQRQASQ